MIVMVILLMISLVLILGKSFEQGNEEAVISMTNGASVAAQVTPMAAIKAERGVFRGIDQASRFIGKAGGSTLQLTDYYARRAFPGAPPFIPHQVATTMDSDFQSCLGCHEKGGFATPFNAYSPITPHPELSNCRQCHVTQTNLDAFVPIHWQTLDPPALGRAVLPGGPPPMPHDLQMRENCSACHSGPAAPAAIRTSHPERLYCRQCHVPEQVDQPFTRKTPSGAPL